MRLFLVLFAFGIAALITATGYLALAVPRWAVTLVGIGAFIVFLLLPPAIGLVADPVNSLAIRKHLETLGASEIKVSSYPNHYGVRFTANGKRHYAKCLVLKRGTFKWKGRSPEELIGGAHVA